MPLTTYVAGDVLTASSLNDNFTFAADNPIGGLAFVNSTAFTTATSVSLPNDTFDSATSHYRVLFDMTAMTTTTTITGRYRTAGVDNSSANYFQTTTGINSAGTASNFTANGGTAFTLGVIGIASAPILSLVFDVFGPDKASITKPLAGSAVFLEAGVYVGRHLAGVLQGSPAFAVDSFTFISSAASSMTGRVTVYKYNNS